MPRRTGFLLGATRWKRVLPAIWSSGDVVLARDEAHTHVLPATATATATAVPESHQGKRKATIVKRNEMPSTNDLAVDGPSISSAVIQINASRTRHKTKQEIEELARSAAKFPTKYHPIFFKKSNWSRTASIGEAVNPHPPKKIIIIKKWVVFIAVDPIDGPDRWSSFICAQDWTSMWWIGVERGAIATLSGFRRRIFVKKKRKKRNDGRSRIFFCFLMKNRSTNWTEESRHA